MKKPAILLCCTALFWFAGYTYPVLLADHLQGGLGASAAFAGLVLGSYGFTQMVLRVPLGYASDRLRKRKPFVQAGIGMMALSALLLYFADTPSVALLGRGAAGMAASSWAIFTVLYASYQEDSQRTLAMSRMSSVMNGAQLVASNVGSLLAASQGTRAAFLLAAVAALAGLGLSTQIPEKAPEGAPIDGRAMLAVARNGQLLRCAVLSILMQCVMWSTIFGFGPQWAQQLGATAGMMGLLSAAHLLPTAVASWASGRVLAPRMGEQGCLRLGFALMAVACGLMPLTTAFWQMLCLHALCGAGVGCAGPMMLSGCVATTTPAYRGFAMGLYQAIYGVGMFLGPLLAGWLLEAVAPGFGVAGGYRAVYGMAAAFALLGVLGAGWLRGPEPAPKGKEGETA